MSVRQQWTFNDSPWLKSRWFQTVSNYSCWQTYIGQPVLSRSDVTRGLPDLGKSFTLLCVFSHLSADYSIVVAHLTSNSFERHLCCMHADYLPSLCFWYSPSYNAYWEWIIVLKLKYPNSKHEHTEFWVMRERHGSRAWLVDIRHNGHTCVSISF